jgi:hypothetical protein
MAIECRIGGHEYVFDLDYGEEELLARIIVRSAEGGPEGLWLVDREGDLEAAEARPGFGPNPAADDGLWPEPPGEMVGDAQRIALAKNPMEDEEAAPPLADAD